MTKPLEYIEISEFRGIFAPFRLTFKKGSTRRSMIVYGGNGTGKSSITDALEWLQSGRIERLAREGARERSYAHTEATSNPYVRAEVRDPALGAVGLVHQRDRVTLPVAEGSLGDLREIAPHPWHVRSEDLARFVLLTKAERFDELAGLMGFKPQVEYQKQLRRVENQLAAEEKRVGLLVTEAATTLGTLVDEDDPSDSDVLRTLRDALRPLKRTVGDLTAAATSRDELTATIESDPNAKKLATARSVVRETGYSSSAEELQEAVDDLERALSELEAKSSGGTPLQRLELLEAGLQLLADPEQAEGVCPLCGMEYPGDLEKHIETELETLEAFKGLHNQVVSAKGRLRSEVAALRSSIRSPSSVKDDSTTLGHEAEFNTFSKTHDDLLAALSGVEAFAEESPKESGPSDEQTLSTAVAEALTAHGEFVSAKEALNGLAKGIADSLETDESRAKIVAARDLVRDVLRARDVLLARRTEHQAVAVVANELALLVDEYVDASINDVQARFDAISADVARYFELLESTTPGIRRPALRLLRDQGRAVVLEIEFRGSPTNHAYGYLSQSQLNSFGLAVFLASVRTVNTSFPFLVLDDVINSFDAYKRPRLAQLLKDEFDDFQLLVLTHDSIWWDRIARDCPEWVRLRLTRYELGSGPVADAGSASLDEIEQFISDDRPELAGRSLGPAMELELQEMAEAFQALVPYNRRNEYTIAPLLERVRTRIGNKLGRGHELYQQLDAMAGSLGFRNLCAHWKDPSSPLTREELMDVFDKWQAVRSTARCPPMDCGSVVAYDPANSRFACRCGATELRKA